MRQDMNGVHSRKRNLATRNKSAQTHLHNAYDHIQQLMTNLIQSLLLSNSIRRNNIFISRFRLHSTQRIRQSVACSHHQRQPCRKIGTTTVLTNDKSQTNQCRDNQKDIRDNRALLLLTSQPESDP
jgi:hypothetical protein